MPQHCVLKTTLLTTKLRIVFDASAKTSTELSLNDLLMVGTNIQYNLFSILIRFRFHSIVLGGDIEKMYHQVLGHEDQRCLQKILWRDQESDDISVFHLNTVTYGTASAAFLATRSLQEVAHIYCQNNPKLKNVILHDFYVDDLLTGGESVDEVLNIKEQLDGLEMLLKCGFRLWKWISNNKTI